MLSEAIVSDTASPEQRTGGHDSARENAREEAKPSRELAEPRVLPKGSHRAHMPRSGSTCWVTNDALLYKRTDHDFVIYVAVDRSIR